MISLVTRRKQITGKRCSIFLLFLHFLSLLVASDFYSFSVFTYILSLYICEYAFDLMFDKLFHLKFVLECIMSSSMSDILVFSYSNYISVLSLLGFEEN